MGVVNPISLQKLLFVTTFKSSNISLADDTNEFFTIDESGNIKYHHFEYTEILSTGWSNKEYPIYTCGVGMFSNRKGFWKNIEKFATKAIYVIKGNGLNDIFAIGSTISHFNGVDWEVYEELLSNGVIFTSLEMKGNTVVACGYNRNADIFVAVGKRN